MLLTALISPHCTNVSSTGDYKADSSVIIKSKSKRDDEFLVLMIRVIMFIYLLIFK